MPRLISSAAPIRAASIRRIARFTGDGPPAVAPIVASTYVPCMFPYEASVPVLGADLSTARAARRREEIARCQPGDSLELRRETEKRRGSRVIGVYSPRGVQIGYIFPDRLGHAARLTSIARAIFQNPDTFGAVARIAFDGRTPTLPQPKPKPRRVPPPRPPADEFCDIFPSDARRSAGQRG